MVRPTTQALLIGGSLFFVAAPVGLHAQHAHTREHVILTPGELVWQDAPPSLPPGAQIAVLEGDPSRPGAFTMRGRLPANYHIPTHWHGGVERVTVISGSVIIGMAEQMDRDSERKLTAGSFFSMPPGTTHYFRTEEEAIVQINGIGPWAITYQNPNDDPRGSAAAQVGEADLAVIRRATERFRDVNAALAEGYLPDPHGMCISAEMEGLPRQHGGMGIHYFRPDLLGITALEPRVNGNGVHTDFTRPSVLIYEPQADGSLELVAIENLVWVKAWREAGNTGPPSFMGHQYYHMIDNPNTDADEAHGFEPHYELHMWLYRENPNGLFAQFNPVVTCEHHRHAHTH